MASSIVTVFAMVTALIAGMDCAETDAAANTSKRADTPRPHVVIAPEHFRDALGPYLAWRASTPQNDGVVFLTLESLLGGGPGAEPIGADHRDAPERIKRALWSRWRSDRIGSCLLVGDGTVFPVRFMALDRSDAAAANWAFYPSDLYYADLAAPDGSFETWNGRQDGFHARYFGEVHGESNKDGPINADRIDLDPEIAVGRWPVSTPEQTAAVAAKTMAWERAMKQRRNPGAVFFAVGGWVDVRSRVRAMAAALGPTLPGGAIALLHDDDSAPKPDADAMHEAFTRGALFLIHTGHGQPWGWEHCLSAAVIDGASQPPGCESILFSAGCSTAEWTALPPYTAYRDEAGVDHAGTTAGDRYDAPPPAPGPLQPGALDRSSLSEQLVCRPTGGAIAVIGCSTGSQPCAVSLLEGFVDASVALERESHASGTIPTLGEAWRRAQLDYRRRENLDALVPTADWYPPSIYFQGMKFVLLGDPALPLPLRAAAP